MNLYIKTQNGVTTSGYEHLENLITFENGKSVYANLKEAAFQLKLSEDKTVYIFGELFYHLRGDGTITLIESNSNSYLEKLFAGHPLEEIIGNLEGQYLAILADKTSRSIKIFSDCYARIDNFYAEDDQNNFCLATDLDFIFKHVEPVYDQRMLAHLFLVFGWYAPKGLTMYRNVKQLRVGEILTLSSQGSQSQKIEFKPLAISDYSEGDLEEYYRILRESVVARANRNGKTWVSSSSGWDSTMLLALLVDEFGEKNVGMLTGSMKYSAGTERINKFEMAKIQKIASFFNVQPSIVDFNLSGSDAAGYYQKIRTHFKSKHMYSQACYNYTRLSDALFDVNNEPGVIVNGETSDSFHNFGFAQFGTFFHTSKAFTEYADKMNCYLYGPSFFKKVINGDYQKDKVFQIFEKMNEGVQFALPNGKEETIQSYLFPFFYGSPRLPFAKTYINPVLTAEGQQAIYNFPFKEYMDGVLSSITPENIYSWLTYLYHSFHAQGSTVNTQKHAMEYNSHSWRMPFNDLRLVKFLSAAPEKWGRGLELNNTKYPLKWVAKNKIKFPYDILEEGPHSYLYDVIEGFSLISETTYRSGVTEFFKDTMREGAYKELLSDEYFDMRYIDNLVKDFLDGKEASGIDLNNLIALNTLSMIGWY